MALNCSVPQRHPRASKRRPPPVRSWRFTAQAGRSGAPRDTVSLARNGYECNVIGFRSVRMVAEAAAAIPLVLSEAETRMTAHPVLRLLARPNPAQDGRSFLESLYGHLQLAGNAYVEAASPDGLGLARELHVLRPDRISVVPGTDGWPEAYDYAVGRKTHRFDNSAEWKPILHLKAFHPLDDHYGMSPLAAAAASVDVHNAAARWSKALLDNAARPSGAIVFKGADGGSLTEEQYRRLLTEIEDNHQAPATPGGRCCSRAGSTGGRWAIRPRTWSSSRPRTPPPATSRWPSACRRCCWPARRQHLFELSGGQPRLLSPDRGAAGPQDRERAGGLDLGPHRRRDRARARPRRGAGPRARARGALAPGHPGELPRRR